ncbi:MAG: hypothetical protein CO182_08985, partial [Lysobacterales bacterium CG_4_9_14_3_um_filter_62_6]
IFVSAYVPYGNYRGSHVDAGGKAWIPLAPAIKEYQFSPGADTLAQAAISAREFTDSWLGSTEPNELPLDALRARAQAWLTGQPGQPLLDSQLQRRTISARPLGLLPASLPGKLVGTVYESTALADADQQWLRIRLRADTSADSAIAFDQRLRVSELLGRRLTLSYQPASEDDQNIVNEFGALAYTPAYLVRVRARLMLRGEPDAVSGLDWTPGSLHRLELISETPAGEVATSQDLLAGGYSAITIGAQAGATPVSALDVSAPNDGEFVAAQRLASLGLRYASAWDTAENELADLVGVLPIRPAPSIALTLVDYQVETLLDLPQRLLLRGVALDAAARPTRAITTSEHGEREAEFLRYSSLHGSALEHFIFENDWGAESVSADKGMRLAFQNGIARVSQTGGVLPASVDLPAPIRAEIDQQLARGWRVDAAAAELLLNQWQGTLWHAEDPVTGASGWFIAGRYAGGSTTTPPDQWTIVFDDPNTPGVNEDPLSVRFIEKIASTDNQITEVDTETTEPLAVRVTDRRFRPVQGAVIAFRVALGEGKLKGPEPDAEWADEVRIFSDIEGVARVKFKPAGKISLGINLMLDPEHDQFPAFVGLNHVTARAEPPAAPGTAAIAELREPISVLAKAGAPASLATLRFPRNEGGGGGGNNQIDPPGVYSGDWVVLARDRFDNAVSNVEVTFTSAFVPPPGHCYDFNGSPRPCRLELPRFYVNDECQPFVVDAFSCASSVKTIRTAAGAFESPVHLVAGLTEIESEFLYYARVAGVTDLVERQRTAGLDLFDVPIPVQWVYVDRRGALIEAQQPGKPLGYRRFMRFLRLTVTSDPGVNPLGIVAKENGFQFLDLAGPGIIEGLRLDSPSVGNYLYS